MLWILDYFLRWNNVFSWRETFENLNCGVPVTLNLQKFKYFAAFTSTQLPLNWWAIKTKLYDA